MKNFSLNISQMIQIKNISKHYSQGDETIDILDTISNSFLPSERIAILGPSGSGKTTLLSILAAFEKPISGQVFFDQTDIHALSSADLQTMRQNEIGFIFQNFELLSALTVLENVMLPLEITKKYSKTECKEKAQKILEKVGLSHRTDFYPSQISGGESQRVAVARALVHSPKYIFADEPTGNLDDENSVLITDLLLGSIEKDQVLVVITHDVRVAEKMDRVLRIEGKGLVEE